MCFLLLYRTGSEQENGPCAFHCIKFATPVPRLGKSTAPAAAAVTAEAVSRGGKEVVGDHNGQELLAVSASLQLFHFANVPIAAVEVMMS